MKLKVKYVSNTPSGQMLRHHPGFNENEFEVRTAYPKGGFLVLENKDGSQTFLSSASISEATLTSD